MTNRSQIEALRGEFMRKTMCEVLSGGHLLALVAHGYENYPEPQFFSMSVDGELLRNEGGILYSNYLETELLYSLETLFPQYEVSTLIDAVADLEELPW